MGPHKQRESQQLTPNSALPTISSPGCGLQLQAAPSRGDTEFRWAQVWQHGQAKLSVAHQRLWFLTSLFLEKCPPLKQFSCFGKKQRPKAKGFRAQDTAQWLEVPSTVPATNQTTQAIRFSLSGCRCEVGPARGSLGRRHVPGTLSRPPEDGA